MNVAECQYEIVHVTFRQKWNVVSDRQMLASVWVIYFHLAAHAANKPVSTMPWVFGLFCSPGLYLVLSNS